MRILCSLLAALLTFTPMASAAAWTPTSGSNGNFTYDSGQDLNGLFQNPAVGEERFFFASPSSFLAVSPGTPASTTDTASVTVSANAGFVFTTVFARVEGNYTVVDAPAQLDYSAVLTIDGGEIVMPLTFLPASPITSDDGTFIGTATINLPTPLAVLSASLTATLSATSSNSATAAMQIENAELSFTTAVPEPSALCVLSLGMLSLRRRPR